MNYLTTPIYYASGEPHLGHGYSTLLADTHQRYLAIKEESCRLLTGTDEHGQKIARLAEAQNVPVAEFVAKKSQAFSALWQSLEVDCEFVRTTDPAHIQYVQECWRKLFENGDLYQGEYTGSYCVDCEQFQTGVEKCVIHNKPLEQVSEHGYFFRLSKYQEALIEHLEAHPEFITPRARYEEALSFLTLQPLQDLCVSRGSTNWGIPVPGDSGQVIYVWLDALLSYVSALGFGNNQEADLARVFASAEHYIGKDILTFHAVYWPAILLALDLPLPKALRVNGWLTVEGQKIAKSNPQTIVDPAALAERYSLDGLRCYLLSCTVGGQDVNFSEEKLRATINDVLANSIGNLVGRCSALIAKHYPEGIPKPEEAPEFADVLLAKRDALFRQIDFYFEQGEVSRACRACFDFATSVNSSFQNAEPWRLEGRNQAEALWWFHGFLQDLTILLSAFAPELSDRSRQVLCLTDPVTLKFRFVPEEAAIRSAIKTGPLVKKFEV